MNINLSNYKIKKDRNYGIDLLRILSMLFIVILHCLGRGGLLSAAPINSYQYKVAWFLEIFSYCAVDIFALISGYVSYKDKEKKIEYDKIVSLWLQVVFTNCLIVGMFLIFRSDLVTKKEIITSFFPVTMGPYWYFTAYVGLYLFLPLLNKAIINCDKNDLRKVFISFIIIFSIHETIFVKYGLNGGYTMIWLIILYILGAIIKKCDIGKNVKPWQAFIGILALCLITYLYKIYGIEFTKLDVMITRSTPVSYTSPTILGIAILYIIGFSKLEFNNTLKYIISFVASSSFAVYLFNCHNLVWDNIMNNRFIYLSNYSVLRICIDVVLFSFIFMLISILIDKVRMIIFKKIKIESLSKKIANCFDKILIKLSNLL